MAVWDNTTKWRQGHMFSADTVAATGIGQDTGIIGIVISHDCDLAQRPDIEPDVEIIVGRKIERLDGNFTHAKSVRRLNLSCSANTPLGIELIATQKLLIPKKILAEHSPDTDHRLSADELGILQRWLSARYFRSAFPDEFNNRLKTTGLETTLRKVATKHGVHIRGIFFDVDGGNEAERNGENDTYTLNVVLVYDTDHDADVARQHADEARQEIENAFVEKCKSGWVWKNIELQSCEVMSDHAITFRQSLSFKEWRSEHISLKAGQPSMFQNKGDVGAAQADA
jgi:hypothetical protein